VSASEVEGADAHGHADGVGERLDADDRPLARDGQDTARIRVLQLDDERNKRARAERPLRREEDARRADIACAPLSVFELDGESEREPWRLPPLDPARTLSR
jgi:hypothetical protein